MLTKEETANEKHEGWGEKLKGIKKVVLYLQEFYEKLDF